MSGSVPPTQLPPPPLGSQSQVSVLGPGIAGLFIQGIETGLVFAQFSQWFYGSERNESSLISTIVVFVTVVGLYASFGLLPCNLIIYFRLSSAQSGVCFVSTWSKCVRQFGMVVRGALLALATSVTRFDAWVAPQPPLDWSDYLQLIPVRGESSRFIAPNPICRPCPYRFPFKLY
jgi:hypothetical protein